MSTATAGVSGTMMAVVTTGNGGYDKLEYRQTPTPKLAPGEVLLQVLAAGVNNTEINTRIGWYSASVDTATDETEGTNKADGGWNQATPFPLIQGTDCCGRVVACAVDADPDLLGKRVLVRPCMRVAGFDSFEHVWMASDFDGAFAQYVKAPASEVFTVNCDWSDAELASIPCAYGTAENMLHRAGVNSSDHVLVTGASGGVGSAVVQLARRRGAQVTAITSKGKQQQVASLGASHVLNRNTDLLEALGEKSVDVVVDNVAGPGFTNLFKLIRQGGRYVSSGAIAGPVVSLDLRDVYLKDITLIGGTAWDEPVFANLVLYIENGDITPLVAKTFSLDQIVAAQKEFITKRHVGKLVLIPEQG